MAAKHSVCIILLFLINQTTASAQHYYNLRDGILDRKGQIASFRLTLAEESPLTKTFDFHLKSTRNDSMTGRVRFPKGNGPFPAALLCVGIETGKEVIAMIEGHHNVILMAVDYPFEGEWNFSGWAAVGTVFRLRSMAVRTIPLLLNCLDWLFQQPEVNKNDVSVVAVSFGVFTGLPAAVIEQRVCRLVVVQGGGSLSTVIAHNAQRWGSPLPPTLSGWLGGAILAPFEPTKYVAYLSPRQLIMINGEEDSFFPAESARRLFDAAREPKEIAWHKSDHIMPGEKERIRELTNIVARKVYQN
jgi:hypothetical protein